MRSCCFALLILTLSLASCKEEPQSPSTATADFVGIEYDEDTQTYSKNSELKGNALFIKREGFIEVSIELINFDPNSAHAAHIHVGDCINPGGHWNMDQNEAFCLTDNVGEAWGKPYAGDIANIRIDGLGTGKVSLKSALWTLGTGLETDIIGKALVVHNHTDDFVWSCRNNELPGMAHSGNTKVACGEIIAVVAD